MIRTYCPICAGRLTDTPHIHDEDVIWPTEHPPVMMLTGLDGALPVYIPDPGENA